MAQGEFTKQEAQRSQEALQEILKGMPQRLQMAYVGYFNDLFLFLEAAEQVAPDG